MLLSHLRFNSENFKIFECAAYEGVLEAQLKLGDDYYKSAIFWYEKAAEQGSNEAKSVLEEYHARKRAEEAQKKARLAKKENSFESYVVLHKTTMMKGLITRLQLKIIQ